MLLGYAWLLPLSQVWQYLANSGCLRDMLVLLEGARVRVSAGHCRTVPGRLLHCWVADTRHVRSESRPPGCHSLAVRAAQRGLLALSVLMRPSSCFLPVLLLWFAPNSCLSASLVSTSLPYGRSGSSNLIWPVSPLLAKVTLLSPHKTPYGQLSSYYYSSS